MKIKSKTIALIILFIVACTKENVSSPSSSSVYTLYSVYFHESEDCSGEGVDIFDSVDFSITLNNDLSYSYTLNDSSGSGNWADGTLNLSGNDARFTINEENLYINMFSLYDTLYSSLYTTEIIGYQCNNTDIVVDVDYTEYPDSAQMYQDGTWMAFISGYCDTGSDNQLETLEECQSVNGAWVTSETDTWDPENQTINMDGNTYSFVVDGDNLMISMSDQETCMELTFLLQNQIFQTDVDCTEMLLISN